MHAKKNINALLDTKRSENINLAFFLLKSQFQYSDVDALKYIISYVISYQWDKDTIQYIIQIGAYKITFYLKEEAEIYAFSIFLFCVIEYPSRVLLDKMYIGSFDYDFGFVTEQVPGLYEKRWLANELFDRNITSFL